MEVILVDKNDRQIGTEEKLKAHVEGKLHRAFSVFIFNSKNEFLLQKRAANKYHSGGLWTNPCCSHPEPGKDIKEEAKKRLKIEMGITCELEEKFSFIYKVKFSNGLYENEYDHVFFGKSNETPKLNEDEASDYRWVGSEELGKDIKKNPKKYTYWLIKCINEVIETANSSY